MSGRDDLLRRLRQTLGDQPTYVLAGAADLIAEQTRRIVGQLPTSLEEIQARSREVPLRAAGALVGNAARFTLRFGQLYDELTRRGRRVVDGTAPVDETAADDEEPFVREPFMPEPLHQAPSAGSDHRSSRTSASRGSNAGRSAGGSASPRRRPPKAGSSSSPADAADGS